jgi:hypothetical protein
VRWQGRAPSALVPFARANLTPTVQYIFACETELVRSPMENSGIERRMLVSGTYVPSRPTVLPLGESG